MSVESLYGVDEDKRQGVDFDTGAGVWRLRFYDPSSVNFRRIVNEISKPFRTLIAAKTLSPEKDMELAHRAFYKACVVSTSGVMVTKDEPLTDGEEAALALWKRYPRLHSALVEFASDPENYRNTPAGEDEAKN